MNFSPSTSIIEESQFGELKNVFCIEAGKVAQQKLFKRSKIIQVLDVASFLHLACVSGSIDAYSDSDAIRSRLLIRFLF